MNLSFKAKAQNQESLWLAYFHYQNINDRTQIFGDVAYRTFFQEGTSTRVHVRPSIRYRPSDRWDFRAGIGLICEFRPEITNRFEIRPYQGVRYYIDPSDRLLMNLYLRVEQRISIDDLVEDNEVRFDLRFRLRLGGRYEFINPISDSFWFIPYGFELFIPVNNEITDFISEKSRLRTGLGYNANENWRFTFYLNLELDGRRLGLNANVDNAAFEFRVRHTIPWSE